MQQDTRHVQQNLEETVLRTAAASTIIVNGRRHEVRAREMTGLEVTKLAHPDVDRLTCLGLTVVFESGPPAARSGFLLPGHATPIADGQTFHVALTDKS